MPRRRAGERRCRAEPLTRPATRLPRRTAGSFSERARCASQFTAFLLLRQRIAHDLAIVAGEDAAIREGRMRPDDAAALRAGHAVGRLEDLRAVDLLVALRGQLGDDQLAVLVEEEKAI